MWMIEHVLAIHGVANSVLACQDCHATTKTSLVKPGHGACFGKCHGPPPTLKQPAIDKRKAVCLSCHTEAALAGAVKQAFTQRPAATPEFQLAIGHLRHAAVACAGMCCCSENADHTPSRSSSGCTPGGSVSPMPTPARPTRR